MPLRTRPRERRRPPRRIPRWQLSVPPAWLFRTVLSAQYRCYSTLLYCKPMFVAASRPACLAFATREGRSESEGCDVRRGADKYGSATGVPLLSGCPRLMTTVPCLICPPASPASPASPGCACVRACGFFSPRLQGGGRRGGHSLGPSVRRPMLQHRR